MRPGLEVATASVVVASVVELAAAVALFAVDQPAAAWLALAVGLAQVLVVFAMLVASLYAAAREGEARGA